MNIQLIEFLQQQTTITVCCIDEDGSPWCFSCFYTLNSKEALLYYKSSDAARHTSLVKNNPLVAGTVLPDKLNKLMIKGIQFSGIVLQPEQDALKDATKFYYAAHPMALAMQGQLWTVQLNYIKMTDSTLGFAKKLSWNREEILG